MPHWPAPPSMHIDHYLNNASNKCYRRLCVSVVHEKRRGGGERKRDWKRLLNDRENCPPSFYRHRSPLIKIFRYFEQDWRRPCFKTCHCKGCTGCLGKFLMFGWIQFSWNKSAYLFFTNKIKFRTIGEDNRSIISKFPFSWLIRTRLTFNPLMNNERMLYTWILWKWWKLWTL